MKQTALLALLLLSACADRTVYEPVEVKVPVPIPCRIPVILHPDWPTRSVSPTADIFAKTKATLAELELRAAYELQLEAAVKTCQ